MRLLLEYLNSLPVAEQSAFAQRCGTTVGYLRKAVSVGQRLNAELCINIERESGGRVTCEAVLPDADWQYLRGTAPATLARTATETVAGVA